MKTAKTLLKLLLIAPLLMATLSAVSQTSQLRGTVLDETGSPLADVSVIVKQGNNTVASATTSKDGAFAFLRLKLSASYNVHFTYVGYEQYVENGVIIEKENSALLIRLKKAENDLNQVVVVGYGTVKKRDLTGSVASVKGSDLTAYVVPDPVLALQGRTPGVQVSQNTGAPDGDFTVRIRGINSIKGNNSPLYIVDGIPFSNYSVNMYDIESMEILKDASATAIYGSRGANGVVLITTKRGKAGKTNVTYNFDYGIQSQVKKLDLMNATEWAKFYNEYLINANILEQPAFSDSAIATMGTGTDWQELMLKNAPVSNHNINLSGGSEKIKYFVSGSALLREGLIPNSSFDKYNIRSSIDFTPIPILDVALQVGYSSVKRMNQSDGGGNGGSSMIGGIYSASPLFVPYTEDGKYKDLRSWFSWSSHELKNPVIMANEATYKTAANLSNVNAAVNLKPIKGLSIRSSLGIENSDSRYDAFTTSKYIYQNNSASINHQRYTSITNENIINYNTELGRVHRFDIMGGYTYQQYTSRRIAASGNTFLSDLPLSNDLGSAEIINTPTSDYTKWALMSYLGRLNYSFRDKYLFTASLRADGSSRYSAGQRWGYFPSFAVAWRVSKEPFMADITSISDLKIRASYGKTGSTAIDPYSTQNLLQSGKAATGNGNFTYYAPGTTYPGSLKWETTTQYDIGFDLSLLNQRLRITGDYYYKYTTDLLNTVFLPSSSGYVSTTRNIGQMNNSGVELSLEGDIIRGKDWQVTAGFNISHNKNEVAKLAGGDDIFGTTFTNYGSGAITIIREGEPLGAFYVFKDAGFNETGQLTYVDMNGDNAYTDRADRYIAGSPFPDFIYGFNGDVRYKNWALNFLIQGSEGNEIFNLSEMRNYSYSQGMNIERKVYYESWREGKDNSGAKYPRIERVGTLRYSDRFLEDASFIRLKHVSLAYYIPLSQQLNWIKGISVYVSAQNYLTLTKYNGMDPEVSSKGNDINSGIDHFTYPNNKTLSFGAKVQF